MTRREKLLLVLTVVILLTLGLVVRTQSQVIEAQRLEMREQFRLMTVAQHSFVGCARTLYREKHK